MITADFYWPPDVFSTVIIREKFKSNARVVVVQTEQIHACAGWTLVRAGLKAVWVGEVVESPSLKSKSVSSAHYLSQKSKSKSAKKTASQVESSHHTYCNCFTVACPSLYHEDWKLNELRLWIKNLNPSGKQHCSFNINMYLYTVVFMLLWNTNSTILFNNVACHIVELIIGNLFHEFLP